MVVALAGVAAEATAAPPAVRATAAVVAARTVVRSRDVRMLGSPFGVRWRAGPVPRGDTNLAGPADVPLTSD
ncbi:hypothetical protein GCM10010361_26100 [Streptomyces olivaceiscleroticus]|uniref:Uncharacterized protein n=1 Tax=Streptomyces olivaceiscleroticus TaxID=68245 RepID=A0ABP3JQH5_9ACTN